MKPYYEDGDVVIYHADFREVELPRGLVVTDPPYNIGYEYGGAFRDKMQDEEYEEMLRGLLLGPSVMSHYPEKLMALGVRPEKCVAWIYHAHVGASWRMLAWYNVSPRMELSPEPYRNPTDKRVAALMERSTGRPARDWWLVEQVKNVNKGEAQHPCPLPLALAKKMLMVTPEPGVVVDPFMGSGTTLRAAKDLGRKAVGVEVDERFCEVAARRMGQGVLALAGG